MAERGTTAERGKTAEQVDRPAPNLGRSLKPCKVGAVSLGSAARRPSAHRSASEYVLSELANALSSSAQKEGKEAQKEGKEAQKEGKETESPNENVVEPDDVAHVVDTVVD